MKPTAALSITDRHRWRELALQRAGTVPPGRVMFCRDIAGGRKVLGFNDVAALGNVFMIPKGADTLCVSPDDFDDVKEWLNA